MTLMHDFLKVYSLILEYIKRLFTVLVGCPYSFFSYTECMLIYLPETMK